MESGAVRDKIDERYITMSREPFYDVAAKYIKKEDLVLDVGCGSGDFAKHLSRDDIYMLDGNIETINKLKESYKNIFHSDVTALPFEDNFFNVIHTSHLIEHLNPENLFQFFLECSRCLKKGGYLVISAPMLWNNFYNDLTHIKPYNPKVIVKYLVRKNKINRSRKIIDSFDMIEETYRYYRKERILHSESFAGRMVLAVFNFILGFFKINELGINGFTIVVQKR